MSSVCIQAFVKGKDDLSHQTIGRFIRQLSDQDFDSIETDFPDCVAPLAGDVFQEMSHEKRRESLAHYWDDLSSKEQRGVYELTIESFTSLNIEGFIELLLGLNAERVEVYVYNSQCNENEFYIGNTLVNDYDSIEWQWLKPPPISIHWEGDVIAVTGKTASMSVAEIEARIRSLGGTFAAVVTDDIDILLLGDNPDSGDMELARDSATFVKEDGFIAAMAERKQELCESTVIGVTGAGHVNVYSCIGDVYDSRDLSAKEVQPNHEEFYCLNGSYLKPSTVYKKKKWYQLSAKVAHVELLTVEPVSVGIVQLTDILEGKSVTLAENVYFDSLLLLKNEMKVAKEFARTGVPVS